MSNKVFVTGGAGYIGSHTCLELLKQKYKVMVFDNLSNGSITALERVQSITNKTLEFVAGDIREQSMLSDTMSKFQPDTVIHLAGLKQVNESLSYPLDYYDVNVGGSLNILRAMSKCECNEIVFSSSAAVYSVSKSGPYTENDPVKPLSPYGRTKLICENALGDWVLSNKSIEHCVAIF